jgi:hypothetical protein
LISRDFAHLFIAVGGPGQSQEWKDREHVRRNGKRTKEWWKLPPTPVDSPDSEKS